jgi:prepilin-type processing-associated H-X9-DG protein
MNNLKQIGLACHNYHDSYQVFPSGNDSENFSAAAYLLPFLEQDNVFKMINFKKPMADEANAKMRALQIKVFMSPDESVTNDRFGPTNYLFSAGSKYDLKNNDGIFFQDSKTGIRDITDGTSNTIMTGETLRGDGSKTATDVKRQHVMLAKDKLEELKEESGVAEFKNNKNIAGDRCWSWMDGRFLQGTFTSTRAINDVKPDVSCDGLGGLSSLRSHRETVNVGFADGSVRAIHKKIKMETWKALGTRNGGEVIDSDF